MLSIRQSIVIAGLALLLVGSAPAAAAPLPSKAQSAGTTSSQIVPEDRATSGSSTEPLSDKLNRSGGIIHPPGDVDPDMTQAPPRVGSKSTPIIPPPGAPGGKRGVNPK